MKNHLLNSCSTINKKELDTKVGAEEKQYNNCEGVQRL